MKVKDRTKRAQRRRMTEKKQARQNPVKRIHRVNTTIPPRHKAIEEQLETLTW